MAMSDDLIEKAEDAIRRIDEQKRSGKCIQSNYPEMVAANMVPGLVAEVKRLREQLAAKDLTIEHFQECCKKYGMKVMRQEANMLKVITRNREQRAGIVKWQEIAIEATAKANTYRSVAISLGYPEKCHAVPASGDLSQAARELDLQIGIGENGDDLTIAHMLGGKKADERLKVRVAYVKRLEAAYLDAKKAELYFREYSRRPDMQLGDAYEAADKEAQDALAKIRIGNYK
jgi:hypothetical protein